MSEEIRPDRPGSALDHPLVSGFIGGLGFALGMGLLHMLARAKKDSDAPRKGSFPRSRNATLLARREPPRPPPRRKPG